MISAMNRLADQSGNVVSALPRELPVRGERSAGSPSDAFAPRLRSGEMNLFVRDPLEFGQ